MINHANTLLKPVQEYLLAWQNQICATLQKEDDQCQFTEDCWTHAGGGGGITRVTSDHPIIERAGVNFSHVLGDQLPASATARRPELTGRRFQALGVSSVIHPRNPYVPTTHANLRFFITEKKDAQPIWWFGGGFDLTPYYPYVEDCRAWHQQAHSACQVLGDAYYQQYKKWADEYFYLKHRQEARGIGGLFFDDLNEFDFARCFEFVQSVGDSFIKAYQPILAKRKNEPYSQREKDFQLYRRGRYVEFNLIYDRGTLFGLQSGGRTESILVSLPSPVHWIYNYQPEKDSPEAKLTEYFLKPKDWLIQNE